MKAVFFDLDGTIFDTLDDIKAAINYAIHVYDGEEASREEIRSYVGRGLRRALSRAVSEKHPKGIEDEEEFSLLFTLMMNYYLHHSTDYTKAYEGIPEMLGMPNKRDEIVQSIVSTLLPDTFDFVSGETMGFPLKPDPSLLLEGLRKVSSSPAEAIYVGDSEVDAETGRRAGITTYIVSYGFRTDEELRKNGVENPIHCVETLSEKLKIALKI